MPYNYDIEGVPEAAGVTFGSCRDPECRRIHIIMLDRANRPIVTGAMSVEGCKGLIEDLKGHMYAVVASND